MGRCATWALPPGQAPSHFDSRATAVAGRHAAGGGAFFPLSVAGAGPRDLVLVALYETLGIPRAAAVATALALLLVTLLVSGLGGVLQLVAPLSPPEQPPAPRRS